ncbi:hypothetical protein [Candidatus Contubernalis alkaliaceticus]|uniref:hypothetical protein n=1 Tax=Candidatus Contubernalis alkaliaceticus TaxID=338645 RepID=UPI001F4BF13C|nr:hypothetical protein [Candidatus Contubernalis alkalaceticus]UNC91676.1 hypothetical protein HUE98_05960 [Candidatus Contubernalis alkalaceticus]
MKRRERRRYKIMLEPHAVKRFHQRLPKRKINSFKALAEQRLETEVMKGAIPNERGALKVEVEPGVWIICYAMLEGYSWLVKTIIREGCSDDIKEKGMHGFMDEIRCAGMVKLELAELELHGLDATGQANKVLEEWSEFISAQIGELRIDQVTEEAFDVIQALYGYLKKLGVDVARENKRHIRKMKERY